MMKRFSILDLPEPKRSATLAQTGMTAEEFAEHISGWEATEVAMQALAEAGEIPYIGDLHYTDNLVAVPVSDAD